MSKRLVLLGLVGLLALLAGFVTLTPVQAVTAVKFGGIWFVAAAMTGLAGFGWRTWRGWRAERDPVGTMSTRERWWAALVIGGATVFLHVHEPHGYKIVADEVVLSSTAMQIHKHAEGAMVLRAHEFAGNFVPLNTRVDKRPLTFPFLLSLVHDLTGYRVENVYWLNGALTVALAGLLFLIGRRLGGFSGGAIAVGWICTVPLVAQNATGAGFELLNMVMILLTVWLGMLYAEQPDNGDRLGAFLMAGILLAQVRYESALFILPVGVVVLYGWWRLRRPFVPVGLLLTPLLLLPIPWQQNVFKLSEESWQLTDIEGATSPFGLQYFYDNVGHAMNFFLSFDGLQPNAWMLGVLGPLAVGFLLLLMVKRWRSTLRERPAEAVFYLSMLGLLLHALLMLSYFWGRWDDPVIRRLSLPTHLLLVLALVHVWTQSTKGRLLGWVMAGLIATQLIGWSLPVMSRQPYNAENFAARTVNWLEQIAKRETAAGRRVLAIDPAADMMWFLHDQAAISPRIMVQRLDQFIYHYERRTFDEVYVIQRLNVDLATGIKTVSADHDLGPGVELELITEGVFAPYYIIRVSRVTAIDPAVLRKWSEEDAVVLERDPTVRTVVVPVYDSALDDWMRNLP